MKNIFGNKKKVLIGMIHLPPTMSFQVWPGMDAMLDVAIKDLKALTDGGFDGALIENDGDHPCKVEGSPDVTVPMTVVARELSKLSKIPLGVEVLLNDPKASLVIAKTCNLSFIRTDYFVDRMSRDGYGEFKIDPKGLMNFKKEIGADDIQIYTDVQVKYARMIKPKTISDSVSEAVKEKSDGVIVSSTMTGKEPDLKDVIEAKKATANRVPVIIGSGLSWENANEFLRVADWAIVGSSIKTNGLVDKQKVKKLVKIVKEI